MGQLGGGGTLLLEVGVRVGHSTDTSSTAPDDDSCGSKEGLASIKGSTIVAVSSSLPSSSSASSSLPS